MKKPFLMDCDTVFDTMYESEGENSLPALIQMKIWVHLLFCSKCTEKLEKYQRLQAVMKDDFFPPPPEFEDMLIERVVREADTIRNEDAPAGFSFRSWVIIGFFVLLSLSSAFFGIDFVEIASSEGLSFLLPVGLTIGMVVTCYGAFFIGSHLKELSTRFRLR